METASREINSLPAEMDKLNTVTGDIPTRTDNAARIGRGLSDDLIEQARELLKNTPRNKIYGKYEDTPFFYEILERRDITKALAHAWVEVVSQSVLHLNLY